MITVYSVILKIKTWITTPWARLAPRRPSACKSESGRVVKNYWSVTSPTHNVRRTGADSQVVLPDRAHGAVGACGRPCKREGPGGARGAGGGAGHARPSREPSSHTRTTVWRAVPQTAPSGSSWAWIRAGQDDHGGGCVSSEGVKGLHLGRAQSLVVDPKIIQGSPPNALIGKIGSSNVV